MANSCRKAVQVVASIDAAAKMQFANAAVNFRRFLAKAEWDRNPRENGKEKNGPLFVSRDALQCLDGFLDRLRLGSLGGLSKQPSSQFESDETLAVRFAIYSAFASAVKT